MINLHVHPLLYLHLPNSALAHLFLCVWLCMSLCDLKKNQNIFKKQGQFVQE